MALSERANAGLHPHVVNEVLAQAPDRQARILDLGCGSGALLGRLQAQGYTELHGIDIAAPAQPAGGIRYAEADFDNATLPYETFAFDLVLCVEVVEHLENPGAVLRELARVLRPGGRLLLTTPNVHSLEARLRLLLRGELKQFDRIGDPTHVSPVFLHPFKLLLQRQGLRIERVWGFPLDGSSPTSRPVLRWAARVLGWLGFKGSPAGDQLCLLLSHELPPEPSARGLAVQPARPDKRQAVTAHYR